MSHDYHPACPGYDERQIWHDGCGECERRGEEVAIHMLDPHRFARAWSRARAVQMGTTHQRSLLNVSNAETRLLQVLGGVQIQLERRGLPASLEELTS